MPVLAGQFVQVFVGGYELTGDSNSLTVNDKRELYDVSAYLDRTQNFIPGRRVSSLDHKGFMNAAAAQSHPVLKGVAVNGVVSLLLGQNATPVVGDPTYSLLVEQGKYSALPEIAKAIPFTAQFANRGDVGGWGRALAVPVSFTNSTNGASVDNGASSSKGGAAFLHILQAAASDTYAILVEGSATGAFGGEQTTIATFTLNASSLGSERIAVTGTVPRYLRWKATRTGSAGNTVRIAVNFVRF